jgi:hypothetical protein
VPERYTAGGSSALTEAGAKQPSKVHTRRLVNAPDASLPDAASLPRRTPGGALRTHYAARNAARAKCAQSRPGTCSESATCVVSVVMRLNMKA